MSALPSRALAVAIGCCALGALAAAPAAHATFPGRNGVISYTRYSSQPDIWTINADGTGAAPIIDSSTYEFGGGWSGDGGRITYLTSADITGQYDLWTADADGSDPQHALHALDLPDDLVPAVTYDPSLSPDGNTIVFDNQQGIHTIPVGGGPLTTLEAGSSSSFNNNPVYSPDGTQIAYGHFLPGDGTGRIEVLDVANPANRTIITDPPTGIDDYQPDWSPDGSKIVFTRFVNGVSSHIYVIDVGSAPGSEQDITPNPNHSTDGVAWSPDGTKLVYRDNDRIMVMNADGSDPHAVGDPEPSGVTDYQVRWQPLPFAIHLEKTGPASANAGDAVPFTLTVTNPGDEPLDNVSVVDPRCDAAPNLVSKNADITPATLDPADSWDFGCSASTSSPATLLHNTATATGTLPSSEVVSDDDAADVVLVVHYGDGGGPASTGGDPTPSDPTEAQITTPVASSITIVQPTTLDSAPSGFEFVGSQFNIDVTDGGGAVQTSATTPFRLVFTIDASLVPATGVESLEAFRDGAVIPPCLASGTANPDPCVAERTIVAGSGDAKITVLSTHASHWNLGRSSRTPYGFSGFAAPIGSGLNKVKAGSVVPLKFGLGGDQGLAIFAAGYPTLQPIDCTTRAATGPAVQTTTGTLTYDRKTTKYTYSWKSPKSVPACFALDLKTNDGVPRVAQFTSK